MDNPFDPESPDYEQTMPGRRELYYEGRKVFHGRFMLKRRIGSGGMGEVWQAVDNELGEDVALKFAPREIANDERSLAELRSEALIGKKLSHPNIVKIYDLHVENGEAGVSMELVHGGSLDELLHATECGYFTPDEIEGWIVNICEALDYAHGEARVAHRDIKPKNILLDKESGRAKLVDFGISSTISDTFTRTTGKGMGGGSLPYMSPQHLLGERCKEQDDLYSLGATIYELLTGAPPFFRGRIEAQIPVVTPPRMTERRAELIEERAVGGEGAVAIPESWERAVAACLAKERKDRPGSGQQLMELLRARIEDEKIEDPKIEESKIEESKIEESKEPPPMPQPEVEVEPPQEPYRYAAQKRGPGKLIAGVVVSLLLAGVLFAILSGDRGEQSPAGAAVVQGGAGQELAAEWAADGKVTQTRWENGVEVEKIK